MGVVQPLLMTITNAIAAPEKRDRYIAVIGSGIMGQGIAQVFIRNELDTLLIDINDQILENAIASKEDIDKMVKTFIRKRIFKD